MQNLVPNSNLSAFYSQIGEGGVFSTITTASETCLEAENETQQVLLPQRSTSLGSSNFVNNKDAIEGSSLLLAKPKNKSRFILNFPQNSAEIIEACDVEISPYEKLEGCSDSMKGSNSNLTTRTNSSEGSHDNQHQQPNIEESTDLVATNATVDYVRYLEEQLLAFKNRNAHLEEQLQQSIHLSYMPGIYNDLSYENTSLAQWKKVYYQPYSHITTMEELQEIRRMCKPFSLICVGAVHKDNENMFVVCAVDFGYVALQRTYSTEAASISQNGIGWYFVQEKSFGFAPEEYIALECSDTADLIGETKHKRLSWKLNGGTGHRIGDKFHCSTGYYKVILIYE